jgi:accessory gene regulator B
MTWTEKLSLHLAKRLKTEDTPYTLGQLAHGIEIFLLNVINALALLIISAIFQVFWEAILLTCLFVLHRLFTGGVHLKNPWTCLTATVGLMVSGGYLLKHFPVIPAPYAQLFVLIGIGAAFLVNFRYAPAQHTYVPTDPKVQRISRYIVLVLLGLGCLLSIYLVEYNYKLPMTYTVAVLMQSVLLIPGSFQLVKRLENTF